MTNPTELDTYLHHLRTMLAPQPPPTEDGHLSRSASGVWFLDDAPLGDGEVIRYHAAGWLECWVGYDLAGGYAQSCADPTEVWPLVAGVRAERVE